MIYAIRAGEAGPIKFGVAVNPRARLAELQTGNHETLRLLAAIDEHAQNERIVHKHLEGDRVHGEWFRPSARAMGLVDAMNAERPDDWHRIVNHVYDADFAAIVWFRRAYLGFEVFDHEVDRARAEGVSFASVRASR